ncbi:HD domain-containing protein [Desulfobacula toluolica]|uniref:Metal-dependent phosphohydrolase n=1 Tax=Desulfobacula toluolica (strain DSM 7467 / Tol2) TaxID=651182 RepID=K0NPT4_DESTT|nr:HD domain-containing protein [Desulfobacula toluolica]CCK82158.1 metal-dependent phosphohydrolase [Desulfobacula toluolica Tol2]
MDPLTIIEKFYAQNTKLYQILVEHSRIVTEKSLDIAKNLTHLNPDIEFIKNAAMLHDIGIFMTRAQSIGCRGDAPYICHGYLGRKLLDEHGLPPEYGLVCERHTGAGITRENIISNCLPLPQRDMVPLSIEEKIICVADKYHSKDPKNADKNTTTHQIIKELEKIDPEHAKRFSIWIEEFNL